MDTIHGSLSRTDTWQNMMDHLDQGAWGEYLTRVYGGDQVVFQKNRYIRLLKEMKARFGIVDVTLFRAPGRTELSGNHTDHNHGHVLAAAVDLDCLAAASPQENGLITLYSEGYPHTITVDLAGLSPKPHEKETPEGLIRGVAKGLSTLGFRIGGFKAVATSSIPMGVGLSSSAAFEILVGRIFNHFYNRDEASEVDLARAGQFAETNYCGKPCGLMDQMSSAVSGLIHFDFENPERPGIERIPFDFSTSGYQPAVVNTGGSHADLTEDYATIAREMRTVAQRLGQEWARGITMDQLLDATPWLRDQVGDRAILRVIHFIQENSRVLDQVQALKDGRVDDYIRLAGESGDSSWRLLQNCYSPARILDQRIPLALTMTRYFLGNKGAGRIHGGGFAGTIQVYVPLACFEEYVPFMEKVFGSGAVVPLRFSNE